MRRWRRAGRCATAASASARCSPPPASPAAPRPCALAAGTGLSYLLSAALAWSVRIRASSPPAPSREHDPATPLRATPRMRLLVAANVIYVFCLNVPEVALPLVLVT
jgi:hypothetical protein